MVDSVHFPKCLGTMRHAVPSVRRPTGRWAAPRPGRDPRVRAVLRPASAPTPAASVSRGDRVRPRRREPGPVALRAGRRSRPRGHASRLALPTDVVAPHVPTRTGDAQDPREPRRALRPPEVTACPEDLFAPTEREATAHPVPPPAVPPRPVPPAADPPRAVRPGRGRPQPVPPRDDRRQPAPRRAAQPPVAPAPGAPVQDDPRPDALHRRVPAHSVRREPVPPPVGRRSGAAGTGTSPAPGNRRAPPENRRHRAGSRREPPGSRQRHPRRSPRLCADGGAWPVRGRRFSTRLRPNPPDASGSRSAGGPRPARAR
jgi:hypothetical protein